MNWLLDTCVLSEYAKRQPHAGVLAWVHVNNPFRDKPTSGRLFGVRLHESRGCEVQGGLDGTHAEHEGEQAQSGESGRGEQGAWGWRDQGGSRGCGGSTRGDRGAYRVRADPGRFGSRTQTAGGKTTCAGAGSGGSAQARP